jgi:hypothetical protein
MRTVAATAAVLEPGARAAGGRALETRVNHAFAFAIGFLLPLLTLKTGYDGTPADLAARVAIVDVVCVLFLALLFSRHRMEPLTRSGWAYLAAAGISLVPALLVWPGPEGDVWTSFFALLMAFAFYILGLNLGTSPALVGALLAGTAVVVAAEAVVVYHDAFFAPQWFPDPMAGRSRGTFKANGQLGAYGFCIAGLLIIFGGTVAPARFRKALVLEGLAAATFVFLASRRTGMFCVFAWGAAFLLLGFRFARRGFYRLFACGFAALLASIGILWDSLSRSFTAQRFSDALGSLRISDGFIQSQLRNSVRTMDQWFPLGFGAGRGRLINPSDVHEVHNGLLAVAVELGALGLIGFLGMMIGPLRGLEWRARDGAGEPSLFDVVAGTFLLISFIFVCHNTLYRDRTFLILLGLLTAVVRERRKRVERSGVTAEVA